MVSIKMFKDGLRLVVIYEGLKEADESALLARLSEQCAEMIKDSCAENPTPDNTLADLELYDTNTIFADYKNCFSDVNTEAIREYCEKPDITDIKTFLMSIKDAISEKNKSKFIIQYQIRTWENILSLPECKIRSAFANIVYLVKKGSL